MREAMIVLPKTDNDGHSLRQVQKRTIAALVAAFGGCTTHDAKGYWQGPDKLHVEPVAELVAAFEPNEANRAKLRKIAVQAGHEARQLAVYVRYASGDVEIIDTSEKREAA